MLRHAAACFKTPTNRPQNQVLRHAAACFNRGCLVPSLAWPTIPFPYSTLLLHTMSHCCSALWLHSVTLHHCCMLLNSMPLLHTGTLYRDSIPSLYTVRQDRHSTPFLKTVALYALNRRRFTAQAGQPRSCPLGITPQHVSVADRLDTLSCVLYPPHPKPLPLSRRTHTCSSPRSSSAFPWPE